MDGIPIMINEENGEIVTIPNKPFTVNLVEPPKQSNILISIVVPVRDEEGSIDQLYSELTTTLRNRNYELIFVDDGSKDNTVAKLTDLGVKVIVFRRNFGKSAALMAGFKEAHGDLIFIMDGDLQDNPKEIDRFIDKIDEGWDLVVGWKKCRHDPISKTIPSKFFNWLTSKLTGVNIHDANCGFKCFRKEVIRDLEIHGEMHRYIPALVHMNGYKVTEIEVEHRARVHGKSKYGITRLVKGFLDLLTVRFTMIYTFRPAHFFGQLGLIFFVIGTLSALFTLYRLLIDGHVTAPAILTVLFMIMGTIFIISGLIAELILNHGNISQYNIKEIRNGRGK